MAEETTIHSELIRHLDLRPFAPFAVTTLSGDRYEVSTENTVAMNKTVMVMIPKNGPGKRKASPRSNQVNHFCKPCVENHG